MEEHKGLIKEVQRDPVTNKIIHLDLEELKGKNKIVSISSYSLYRRRISKQKGNCIAKGKG